MENCIPKFWEREWKIAFPTFGNGNGNEKLIPKLWERESEACIPENGREREFPLTPGVVTMILTQTGRSGAVGTKSGPPGLFEDIRGSQKGHWG